MLKPSERIIEICEERRKAHGKDGKCELCGAAHHQPIGAQFFQEALIRYLDEQHDKQLVEKRKKEETGERF